VIPRSSRTTQNAQRRVGLRSNGECFRVHERKDASEASASWWNLRDARSHWFRECWLSEPIGLERVMNFTPQSDVEFTVEKWASVFAENNPDTYRGTVFLRTSSATAPHLPDADRPSHAPSDGQTRDLPTSDAIPLHVMWP
jgi:hypothetical protein